MDQQVHARFLARYREVSEDQLREIASIPNDLVEEAKAALQVALEERGLRASSIPASPLPPSRRMMSDEERAKEVEDCSNLWKGSLSKRIHFLFFAQALVFTGSLLGTSDLKAGCHNRFMVSACAPQFRRPVADAGR
jgi:hypothetical protein